MSAERILVVDDNPTNLKLLSFILETMGHEVHCVADAAEALAAIGSFRPRLMLVDLQLPGMDGFELTRRLKADPETSEITIVAVTAYAMKGDDERAAKAGCDGYLTKPIDTRALPGIINGYLANRTEAGSYP
jgi:CheY-like chemotaxis protein